MLSLSYIPVMRIAFSLVTVTISSYLIDWVKEFELPAANKSKMAQQQSEF